MNKKSHLFVCVSIVLIVICEFIYVYYYYSGSNLFNIRLTQFYGLSSIAFLYTVLITGPIRKLAPTKLFTSFLVENRKYIGLGAWLFALLHGINSFTTQLGGLSGLQFLSSKFLLAVILGAASLLILCIMAGTSIEPLIQKIGFRNWKLIHKLIYICACLVIIHALMLGSHFSDLSKTIPTIFHLALIVLVILESLRLEKETTWFKAGPITVIGLLISLSSFYWYPELNIGIHPAHSEEVPSNHNKTLDSSINQTRTQTFYMPGMQGDSKLKFTVNTTNPQNITANEPVTLSFKFFNASNGDQISYLATPYEKPVHVIVVDENLNYFNHLHPDQTLPGEYTINTLFPANGQYRLYVDFQPLNAIEQTQALTIKVGNNIQAEQQVNNIDSMIASKNGYLVELKSSNVISIAETRNKNTFIEFFVSTDQHVPVGNISPYLNTSGHLVLINKTTHDYYHLHAALQSPPQNGQLYGPELKFLLMESNTPFKPGMYRAFLQIKPNNQLEVFQFDIHLQ